MKHTFHCLITLVGLLFLYSCSDEKELGDRFLPFNTDFPKEGMTIGSGDTIIDICSATKQPNGDLTLTTIFRCGTTDTQKEYSYGDFDYIEDTWYKVSCNRYNEYCSIEIQANNTGKDRKLAFSVTGHNSKGVKQEYSYGAQLIVVLQKAE